MTGARQIQPDEQSRAVVLGGGGITGIAWEIGVLVGLLDAGVALRRADAVIGTSAGAFVGVALASGHDMGRLFAAQAEPKDSEISATASPETMTAWYQAFATGSDPQSVGAAFGDIAKADPEPVPTSLRRTAVEGRLVTTDWPATLRVTAIDAETGELHVFDSTSGVSLVDAVSASGAVPGVWPMAHIGGRAWIDGGMVSSANSRLADGFERVVVLAPMPDGYGLIPGAADDVDAMSSVADVILISPDEASDAAIGPNPYDPQRCAPVAEAGRQQGTRMASAVAAMW